MLPGPPLVEPAASPDSCLTVAGSAFAGSSCGASSPSKSGEDSSPPSCSAFMNPPALKLAEKACCSLRGCGDETNMQAVVLAHLEISSHLFQDLFKLPLNIKSNSMTCRAVWFHETVQDTTVQANCTNSTVNIENLKTFTNMPNSFKCVGFRQLKKNNVEPSKRNCHEKACGKIHATDFSSLLFRPQAALHSESLCEGERHRRHLWILFTADRHSPPGATSAHGPRPAAQL